MANKAFQKVYTQLEAITKATVSLKATGVSNDELALVDGRLAQVVYGIKKARFLRAIENTCHL